MESVVTEPRCAVVELRQYTLHPGQRDVLIELFERAFIDPLEATGMSVMGQFHDLERPDRFVWMRGFPDMARRAQSLAAFYGGPVWQAHRAAANATMIDSDNVLLLRPARADAAISLAESRRVPPGGASCADRVVVTLSRLRLPADRRRIALFDTTIAPALRSAGARVLGHYVTEPSANTYPRLPVREGENVTVWFTAFADDDACARCHARLAASPEWRAALTAWNEGLAAPLEVLRLAPTPRSLLRGPQKTARSAASAQPA